jgi:hypothetical protein
MLKNTKNFITSIESVSTRPLQHTNMASLVVFGAPFQGTLTRYKKTQGWLGCF